MDWCLCLFASLAPCCHYNCNLSFGLEFLEFSNPSISHFFCLSGELTWGELDVVVALGEVHLKSVRLAGILRLELGVGGPRQILRRVVNKITLFLLAVIHQAAILRNPHLTFKPILGLHSVSLCLELPQICFKDRCKLVLVILIDLLPSVFHSYDKLSELRHVVTQLHGRNSHAFTFQSLCPLIIFLLRLGSKVRINLLVIIGRDLKGPLLCTLVQPLDFRASKLRSLY
mmetsp:Transcript_139282/g.259791  ORF Transcript_139282/g.259791 Transcript_139282/m.259791 type:complete len:229 (+) Transcript_139282:158-844(+)